MSVKNLKALVAVAEQGSFAAAADYLCLTQSAVSQQISALESELGLVLFDRTGRSPQLNTDGHQVVVRARMILAQYAGLSDGLGDGLLRGELAIGAIYTVQLHALPPVLSGLRQQHPELFFRLYRGMSDDLVTRVDQGELDGVIVTGPPLKHSAFSCWHTLTTETFFLIAPGHLTGQSAERILTEQPFIRFDRRAWAGVMIEQALNRRGIQPNDCIEVDSLMSVFELIRHGLGVAIMPLTRDMEIEMSPSLYIQPFAQHELHREIGFYQRRQHNRQQATQVLLEHLMFFYQS